MIKICIKYFCQQKIKLEADYLKLDYFTLLNVDKNSTNNEIRKNYYLFLRRAFIKNREPS